MKILLTGGTGFIGTAVLDRLVAAGHQVTAVVRSQSSSLQVEKAGAVGVIGDLFDAGWLASELAHHDAGIHTAAGSDQRDAELNTAVIDAAIESFGGTDKPFVLTGGIWTYGSNGSIVETDEPQPIPLTGWRVEGEQRLLDSDVNATVVQPGIVYGHGAGIPSMLAGWGSVPGTGEQHWTTVHVDDLADLYVSALEGPGGTFVGTNGQNPTVAELGEALGLAPEGDQPTLDRLGPFGEALLLDQQATGEKAQRTFAWTPSRPSLVEELQSGYSAQD